MAWGAALQKNGPCPASSILPLFIGADAAHQALHVKGQWAVQFVVFLLKGKKAKVLSVPLPFILGLL